MSQYPGGLDAIPTNKVDDTPTHIDHPGHHNLLADAVNKLQTALGLNPQGASPDVKTRLNSVDTSITALTSGGFLLSADFTLTTDGATYYLRDASGKVIGTGADPAALMEAHRPAANSSGATTVVGGGNYVWGSVPTTPKGVTRKLHYKGTANTLITLSNAGPRFFDPDKTADGDVFQNIEFSDFLIDCAGVGGINHVVYGVKRAGVDLYLLSFDNIIFRRIRTINVPSCQTYGSVSVVTNHRLNIDLASWHHNNAGNILAADSHTFCTNILVDECNFQGGNVGAFAGGAGGQTLASQPTGLAAVPSASGGTLATRTYYYRVVAFDANGNSSNVSAEVTTAVTGPSGSVELSWTAPAGASGTYQVWRGTEFGRENVYYTVVGAVAFNDTGAAGTSGRMPIGVDCFCDNVTFKNSQWSALGVLTAYAPQEGFQIGSKAYGGRYLMQNLYAYGSGDNNYEVDGHSYCLMDNLMSDGIGGFAIDGYTLAGFSTPLDNNQETIYRNCTSRFVEATTGNPRGWGLNGIDSSSSTPGAWVGVVTMQGCRVFDGTPTWGANGRIVRINGDLPQLKLLDTRLIQPSKNVSLTGTVQEYAISWVGATELNRVRLVIRDLQVSVNGTMTLNGFATVMSYILLGTNTFELDFDNIVTNVNMPGVGAHFHRGIDVPNFASGTVIANSIICRYKPTQVGDGAAQGLTFGDSTHIVINDKLLVKDPDFTSLGNSSSELSFSAPSVSNKVFLVRPRMHTAFPIAPSAITVTASPFVYQNLDGYAELVTVQGGTVSLIEFSSNAGANYTNTGVVAGSWRLENDDRLRVTYSVLPTMNKVPLK